MRKLLSALSILALVSVGFYTSHALAQTSKPTKAVENMARAAVRDGLKDPQSAQFSGLFTFMVSGVRHTCGYVNAKNSYGGYTGKQAFAVLSSNAEVDYVATEENSSISIVMPLCDPAEANKTAKAKAQAQAAENELEKSALCSRGTDGKTEGQCGEWYRKCEAEFRGLNAVELAQYMNLCRRSGYEAAKSKWDSTLGQTITFPTN